MVLKKDSKGLANKTAHSNAEYNGDTIAQEPMQPGNNKPSTTRTDAEERKKGRCDVVCCSTVTLSPMGFQKKSMYVQLELPSQVRRGLSEERAIDRMR